MSAVAERWKGPRRQWQAPRLPPAKTRCLVWGSKRVSAGTWRALEAASVLRRSFAAGACSPAKSPAALAVGRRASASAPLTGVAIRIDAPPPAPPVWGFEVEADPRMLEHAIEDAGDDLSFVRVDELRGRAACLYWAMSPGAVLCAFASERNDHAEGLSVKLALDAYDHGLIYVKTE